MGAYRYQPYILFAPIRLASDMVTKNSQPQASTRKAGSTAAPAKAAKTAAPVKAAKSIAAAKAAGPTSRQPAAKAAKPAKDGKAPQAHKPGKDKLVRDSFTIPASEYEAIAKLKQRALKMAHPAKKSEVLRAGLRVLSQLADGELVAALQAVPSIKTGRPKRDKGEAEKAAKGKGRGRS